MKKIVVITCAPVHAPTLEIINNIIKGIRGKELQKGEGKILKNKHGIPQMAYITLDAGGAGDSRLRRQIQLLVDCTTTGKPYIIQRRDDGTEIHYYRAGPLKEMPIEESP